MDNKHTRIYFFLFMMFYTSFTYSQEALEPRLSPLDITSMRYHDTYIKITYSRPHKNGRTIFGKLVPYGEVWRTGANEATELTVTNDILAMEDTLKAGTYALFTIPGKEWWTIIFNRDLGLWGAYNYKEEHDVMRIEVPVEQTEEIYKPFTIKFDPKGLRKSMLVIRWDQTKVSIPIEFIVEESK